MPPNTSKPWALIVEAQAFRVQCGELCQALQITHERLDDMLQGLTGAIAADPLSFVRIGDSDAYGATLRGFDIHPNLVVVYTYNLNLGEVELEWIGSAGAGTATP